MATATCKPKLGNVYELHGYNYPMMMIRIDASKRNGTTLRSFELVPAVLVDGVWKRYSDFSLSVRAEHFDGMVLKLVKESK